MPACNVRVKRERGVNPRQDRCCEVELQTNVTGKTGKAFAALKLSQKTCLLSNVSDSSGSRMIGSFKISGLDI